MKIATDNVKPELYPEKLKQDKKTQDKKLQKFNKILEICKEPKSLNEIMIELGYKSNRTLKRDMWSTYLCEHLSFSIYSLA